MSETPRPQTLFERPVPDLALPSSTGGLYRLREHVGRGPQVLFFFVHHGTPG
jgi:peroxiredoxin